MDYKYFLATDTQKLHFSNRILSASHYTKILHLLQIDIHISEGNDKEKTESHMFFVGYVDISDIEDRSQLFILNITMQKVNCK